VQIRRVTLTVESLDQAADFYRDVLQFPVAAKAGGVAVTVGSSLLLLEPGEHFRGVHHMAFGITPADFELARAWFGQRVEPIVVDGSEVIEGPQGWNATSVYFLGPEGILLEFIARASDGGVHRARVMCPDRCPSARLASVFLTSPTRSAPSPVNWGCRPSPARDALCPGRQPRRTNHPGRLILVDDERIWFPTDSARAARGPVALKIDAPRTARLTLRQTATVLVDCRSSQ